MESISTLGKHLILEVWGAEGSLPFWQMDEAAEVLKQAAIDAGATVLSERWHHFGEGFGYTGVVILAESHISVHSWPEHGYSALDIFMCGIADPMLTIPAIEKFYKPHRMETTLLERGKK
jgi:S-adenosylmethionine decarboxylase